MDRRREAKKKADPLPQVGEKLTLKIQEFLEYGFIKESRVSQVSPSQLKCVADKRNGDTGEVQQSERYRVLKLLTSVHDVGKLHSP